MDLLLFIIPVSLSYASTGFMPGSSVGASGVGWSLPVGGVITREERGMPRGSYADDEYRMDYYTTDHLGPCV